MENRQFSINGNGSTDYMKKMNLDSYLTSYTKNQSLMNYRYTCKKYKVNHLRENTEEDLCDIQVGKYFLNWSQKALKKKD